MSHFSGSRSSRPGFETRVFAFFQTFRFTGSPSLYLECDVRMCHGECPVSGMCHGECPVSGMSHGECPVSGM